METAPVKTVKILIDHEKPHFTKREVQSSRSTRISRRTRLLALLACTVILFIFFVSSLDTTTHLVPQSRFNSKDVEFLLPDDGGLNKSPRVMIVMGTRPETIKMFPIIRALNTHGINPIICVTGQHQEMVEPLLRLFDIKPHVNLNVMKSGQSLNSLTERIVGRMTKAVTHYRPDWLLVQGDTTSAFVASVVAFHEKIAVGHVEAGLRTYKRYSPFPEETSRRLIAGLASYHFVPTQHAANNLKAEGIPLENVYITGNTVIDALQWVASLEPSPQVASSLLEIEEAAQSHTSHYRLILVTMHRRENLGAPLISVCKAIKRIVDTFPDVHIVLPVHMNPTVQETVTQLLGDDKRITLLGPLSYEFFAQLLKRATLLLTDSGGVQEEGTAFSKPILVLRNDTERPEGVTAGVAKLIGTDEDNVFRHVQELLTDKEAYAAMAIKTFPYGDGTAGSKIVDLVLRGSAQIAANRPTIATEKLVEAESAKTTLTNVNEITSAASIAPRPRSFVPAPAMPRQLNLTALLNLPSSYPENGDGKGLNGITAVISGYNRVEVIPRLLGSLFNQTVPPLEIWITVFASKSVAAIKQAVDEFANSHKAQQIPIKFLQGDVQLKYFGRFEVGLQIPTKYAVFFDDDCLPGANVFRNFLHVQNIVGGEFRGLYGAKGHIVPVQNADNYKETYGLGQVIHPEVITQVDLVGGIWFMEKDWIKLMFRENAVTWETGEDFQITYALSKYANLPTFVFPIVAGDLSSHLVTPDYRAISASGDTTHGAISVNGKEMDIHRLRDYITFKHFTRGHTRVLMSEMWRPKEMRILFLVDTIQDAKLFKPLHEYIWATTLQKPFPNIRLRPFPVLIGRYPQSQLLSELGISWSVESFHTGVFDLGVAAEFSRKSRAVDIAAEVMMSFQQVIETVRPDLIIVPNSPDDPAIVAAAITARSFNGFNVVAWNKDKANDVLLPDETKSNERLTPLKDLVDGIIETNEMVATILEEIAVASLARRRDVL
ncbi:UDP-N-acetylglucosamine 2-epimerase (non-hydrolysing) [Spizellomyces sp. 'palustris']|nr:UDP-N-acetylglucosamine 2-epimerase (non-hydrolysing) [Spizellomyces sp. 'palustris']